MSLGLGPLLERHRVFHSRDTEETRAFLGGKDYRFDPAWRRDRQLDARINAVYMPSLYIAYIHYGTVSVALTPGVARKDHLIQLPLSGHLETRIGGHSIACSPQRAAIASPGREKCQFLSSADSARIQLCITGDALTGQLAALLGQPPDAPLDFAPAMDLAAGYGQSLARYVRTAVADLDQPDSVLLNPITMSMFQQFIMTGLLLSHPHNYLEALRRRALPIAPRDVKRAIDYIEANLDSAVTLGAIVEASGVAGRTLLKHFRDTKGVSPMRYLCNARFEKVRIALAQAQPGESVTTIAMSYGFSHLGRFSVEYRRRFGESPSDTLRRRHPLLSGPPKG
jgi:AraC-like DNA-binding protein